MNHLKNRLLSTTVCLMLSCFSYFGVNAQITDSSCQTGTIEQQCLCWINLARNNPPDMATYLDNKLKNDAAFRTWTSSFSQENGKDNYETTDTLVKKAIRMMKGKTTTPPPVSGRTSMKTLTGKASDKGKAGYVYYPDLPALQFDNLLQAAGEYHFNIGMKDGFGHTDVNGKGDINKIPCLCDYNISNASAGIYGGTEPTGFRMFIRILTGFSHVRPMFNILENWKYAGIYQSSSNFIVIWSKTKPKAFVSKTERNMNLPTEANLCPADKLPKIITDLPLLSGTERASLTNLAKNKTASQSSQYKDANDNNKEKGFPNLATDGNQNGDGISEITHTEVETHPWWQVDLGAEKNIYFVDIYNRDDCCQQNLNDLTDSQRKRKVYVEVSNDSSFPANSTHSYQVQKADEKSWDIQVSFTGGKKGRYVRIKVDNSTAGDASLSLAEVEVYGK